MFRDKMEFNFWPSFTDLMLSLVLVVLTILFVIARIIAVGSDNLDQAHKSQQEIQQQIQQQLEPRYKVQIMDNISSSTNNADIYIYDQLDRQTITFSDKVLFDSGKSQIKPQGYALLNIVGPIIAQNLNNIVEIQIQGHADTIDTDAYNLTLAAQRAIAVYWFLQWTVGIDPSKYMMSATSFGKYKPVGRETGKEFNRQMLYQANSTPELQAKNRRIEIVLYFKNKNQ